ncbi:MAG: HEAT repeat domain-containing protein [Oligoflexia bacterium]|nr:HEAT repeat domain-containing protein [Oligoflexia bacterium]
MSKKDGFINSSGSFISRGSLSVVKAIGTSVGMTIKTIGKSCSLFGSIGSFTKGVCTAPKKIAGMKLGMNLGFGSIANGSKKVTGMFTGGLRKKFGLNKSEVKNRIAYLKNKINELYLEMGKVGSNNAADPEKNVFDSKEVQELTIQIENYEREMNNLNKYLNEIEELEKQNIRLSEFTLRGKDNENLEGIDRKIQSAIESCVRKAKFPLKSDAIVFQKVLYDLLDKDMDIRRLAVSQLGKMGNKHTSIPLKEVLKIKNEQLQAEVINALILLEDLELFSICKSFIKHDYAPLRSACVRGLYKSGKQESIPILITSLQDENSEIRNSSAMFLGWLDAKVAIPSLLQAALDSDRRVKLSAISSLSNIRDETSVLPLARLLNTDDNEIRQKIITTIGKIIGDEFKFNSAEATISEEERTMEIAKFKDWYLKKKHGVVTAAETTVSDTDTTTHPTNTSEA